MSFAGDKYHVRYQRFESPCHVVTSEIGPFDTWADAKEHRNHTYLAFPQHVRTCWIERSNSGLNLRTERYGAVMKRLKPAK